MSECICNTCRNLKSVLEESGAVDQYECSYGFPSDNCSECDGEGCEISCVHYADDEEDMPVKVKCARCGRELEQLCSENGEGEVYCAGCYLDMMK
jgi:hypothetical protein